MSYTNNQIIKDPNGLCSLLRFRKEVSDTPVQHGEAQEELLSSGHEKGFSIQMCWLGFTWFD